MTRHGRLFPLALLAASIAFTGEEARANATPVNGAVPSITWTRCGPDHVDRMWIHAWGDRLQCGNMRAPLDYDDPASRDIDIGLVRVTAATQADRQGSLFTNFGGPGVSPQNLLAETAAMFQVASPSHPVDGLKRRIADQFDLVAVIPRGLKGSVPFSCAAPLGIPSWRDTTVYLADWNWAGFVRETRDFVTGCRDESLQGNIGTYAHVRDMERARVALGEPVLNYLGISYGTYVGASYAATFPATVGRFVLDSVMNYAGTFEQQLAVHAPAKHGLFRRTVLQPALANVAYGLGTSEDTVMQRLAAMPPRLQGPWQAKMESPAELAAMLVLADWVREEMATWTNAEAWDSLGSRLLPRIGIHRFSTDDAIDNAIRSAATALASPLRPSTATPRDLSMYYAVVCGDTPWRKTLTDLRAMANTIAARYPTGGGAPVTVGLVCHHWQATPRPAPPLTALAQARPMLLVQAEFDPSTPLEGALNAFDASPGSRIVVARGMRGHGVFGLSATPCVERSVGTFLLTGELPTERFNHCDYVPEDAHPRPTRDDHELPPAHELREHLRDALRDS